MMRTGRSTEVGGEDGQRETLVFLRDHLAACEGAPPVETVSTHISHVLLAGRRALKLKRAVRLPYVDFATPEKRLAACQREDEVNRRGAPMLYRGVRRVTRAPAGDLALDGEGPLVDAVVEMERFDAAALLDVMARAGRLDPPLLAALAEAVAIYHEGAAVYVTEDGTDRLSRVVDGVIRDLDAAGLFDPAEVAAFAARGKAELERHRVRLDARGRAGRIRRGHGDLHLRNICLVEGRPVLFDALEFDEALATVDVLYDLAFLLMDLWRRGLHAGANLVLNRYLDRAPPEDEHALSLLPFMMAVRAAIRAHIAGRLAGDPNAGADHRAAARLEALESFALARELLRPQSARVIAIGGFSGSGKSTVAARLAPEIGPPPGARILASDRIRKAMLNAAPQTRLPPEAYRPEVSEKVYATLIARAAAVAAEGHAAIADAVFDRAADRRSIADAALAAGVPFDGLWLEVDPERLAVRVRARRNDVSDATESVLASQLARGAGDIDWTRIPAAANAEDVARSAAEAVVAVPPIGARSPAQ
ncbi:bifunctional aminoglycoside phosphotransferase/ATP-binding protein [Ancylobacter terrae]|uniref:bifunctional aminoglycoside phosphotransferase/ATP-binding protein n=1 Tax=Ancylobacter sp. sgz301288 TaxID=3342077 RepID=UPI00385A7498